MDTFELFLLSLADYFVALERRKHIDAAKHALGLGRDIARERRRNRSTDSSGPMMPIHAEVHVPLYTIKL